MSLLGSGAWLRRLPAGSVLRDNCRWLSVGSPTVVSATEALEGDEGPSPKELVLAGLASCTSMTVRIYADNMFRRGAKGWESGRLDRVLVHAEEITRPGAHVPDCLEVRIALEGDLTAEQRRRLAAAAERCPVKRMLTGGLAGGVASALVEPPSRA
ncbi:OsmC/Ohr family [Tribonema minus]|uniref:OsmC/Ohr family n=1 Tax=Tribonema minus TaxID=303371 RepID=A0A835ZFT6_9STRA|nr:OsmC/Ohr family [Tribonema minus]